LELLIKFFQKTDIDLDAYSGLKRASKSQYKTQGRLPSFATLFFWATELDVNLHWLLLGEGPMFRKDMQTLTQGEIRDLRNELTDVLRENRKLQNENRMLREQQAIEQHDVFPSRARDARIGSSAAPSPHTDIE